MTGAPDVAHKQYYSDFVASLKAAGVWSKIAVGWLTSDLDAQASGLNIKNPATFPLSPQNSPTHTSYRGFSGNGTSSYIKTGFIPSTHGVGLIGQYNAHIAAFDLTERGTSSGDLGSINSTGSLVTGIRPRYTGGLTYYFINGNPFTANTRSSQGMHAASRSAVNLAWGYRDGVLIRGDGTSSGTGIPTREAYLLALNNLGTATLFNTDTLSFYSLGAFLSAGEQIALSNAVWTWLKNVGAVPAYPLLVCADGNSLTVGLTGAGAYTYTTSGDLTDAAIKNAMINKGVSGQTTLQMSADAAADIDTLLAPTGGPVHSQSALVAWEIFNDIQLNGASPSVAVDHMQAYCSARRTAGWGKIVVCNMLNHKTIGGWTHDTSQSAVNAELTSRWANFADAMVDLAAIVALQDNTNTTYWNADQIHLTQAGYALVGSAVATSIEAAL